MVEIRQVYPARGQSRVRFQHGRCPRSLSTHHHPKYPLICLDEFSNQPPKEKRASIPADKGRANREDSEYIREDSATAFVAYAPLEGTRAVHISEDGRRTASDYADVIEYVVDEMFPKAEKIVLVEDNLDTYKDASLYEALSPDKARRLANKIERHPSYPKVRFLAEHRRDLDLGIESNLLS